MATEMNVSIQGEPSDVAALVAELAGVTTAKLTTEGNTIRFELADTSTAANLATAVDALAAVTT